MRNMPSRLAAALTLLFGAVAACESAGPIGSQGEAVVEGTVESGAAATPAERSGAAAAHPANAPGVVVEAQATSVVIAEVQGGGALKVLAEAAVDAQGRYRLEGVPANRSELLIRAHSDAGGVVGSVVLHEETRADAEHRAHPINVSSTLHAEAWLEVRASGSGSQGMGAAELALFLDAASHTGLSVPPTADRVEALAAASVQAQQAITAVLASEGHAMSATARSALLLALAAQRDRDRDAGVGASASQRAYLSASISALTDAGIQADALALAYAAAATVFDAALEAGAAADVRAGVVRNALLLGVESRKHVAATVTGAGSGHASVVASALHSLEGRVHSAGTVQALQVAVAEETAAVEAQLIFSIVSSLVGLPGGESAQFEAELAAAIATTDLAAELAGVTTAQAAAAAAASFRAEVEAAASAVVAAVPSGVSGAISTEVIAALLLCIGANPSIG